MMSHDVVLEVICLVKPAVSNVNPIFESKSFSEGITMYETVLQAKIKALNLQLRKTFLYYIIII